MIVYDCFIHETWIDWNWNHDRYGGMSVPNIFVSNGIDWIEMIEV